MENSDRREVILFVLKYLLILVENFGIYLSLKFLYSLFLLFFFLGKYERVGKLNRKIFLLFVKSKIL